MPDTSVFIALDRERNLDLLGTDHSEQVALSVVVLGELLVAAKHPGRNREEREASMEFVEQLKASSVLAGVDDRTAEIFSELRAYAAQSGKPRGINDLWIAATAIQIGAELITLDSRAGFDDLPGLRLRP